MRCTIVHNPVSRRGHRVARAVRAHLAADPGVEAQWITRPGPADEPHGDRVIVVGGDGTVNIAATWLMTRDARLPIGIVPGGTGNNLARGLGLPTDPVRAIPLALRGTTTRPIDGARVEAAGHDGVCLQSAALGFPAETSRRFDELRRRWWFRPVARLLGDPAYTLVALARLPQLRRRPAAGGLAVELSMPETTVSEPVLAVFLCNEPTVGGGFTPAPRAAVDDGLLDVCWVRHEAPDPHLEIFRRLRRGTHVELTDSVGYRQTAGPLTVHTGEPSTLMVDGELIRDVRDLRMTMMPRRFDFVVAST